MHYWLRGSSLVYWSPVSCDVALKYKAACCSDIEFCMFVNGIRSLSNKPASSCNDEYK